MSSSSLPDSKQRLTSTYEIVGMPTKLEPSKAQAFRDTVLSVFEAFMSRPGHRLEFVFTRHPVSTQSPGEKTCAPTLVSHAQMTIATDLMGGAKYDENLHQSLVSILKLRLDHDVIIKKVKDPYSCVTNSITSTPVKLESDGSYRPISFEEITEALEARLPWQMKLVFESGRGEKHLLRSTRSKRWLQALTRFKTLKFYDQSLLNGQKLTEYSEPPVLIRSHLSFSTWGDAGAELRGNESTIQAYLSNSPVASIAESGVMTLEQAVLLLPITHIGSPWKPGEDAVTFLTPEGEAFSYKPQSIFQRASCELIVDPRGAGNGISADYHRVVSNALRNHGGQIGRLAAITVDANHPVYESAEKDPPASRIRFGFERNLAVNLIESPLGVQSSTSHIKDDLGCLLGLLCKGMFGVIDWWQIGGALAVQIYELFALDKRPKPYLHGVDEQVDSAITLLGRAAPDSWWEVSEQLIALGFGDEALRAHRQAVPTLKDVQWLLTTGSVLSGQGFSRAQERELAAHLGMLLTACPSLALPTKFDLSGVKYLTLDLDSSITIGSLSSSGSLAIQYLLARRVAVDGMFRAEWFKPVKDAFIPYREGLVDMSMSIRKISYMNIDRIADQRILIDLITQDLRMSRMSAVEVTIGTRSIPDPGHDFWHSMTTIAIFNPCDLNARQKVIARHKFGISFEQAENEKRDRGFLFQAVTATQGGNTLQYLLLP